VLTCGIALDASLLDLLPEGVQGIIAVIKNNMNQSFTYEIIGPDAVFLGEGDLHEDEFDDMKVDVDLALHTNPAYLTTAGNVLYRMVRSCCFINFLDRIETQNILSNPLRCILRHHTQEIYPSTSFQESYDSNTPEVYAAIVASTFVAIAIMFFLYDVAVTRRNENLVAKAAQSNAIVSVRPENVVCYQFVLITRLTPLLHFHRRTVVTLSRVHQKPSNGRETRRTGKACHS
jgi:hypothetical protein